MRLIFILAVTFLLLNNIYGQEKAYVVRAGEIPSKVLPAEAMYVFPVFKQGTVLMRDGSASTAKLNFNILLNEMQFIDNKGDTLTIAYPQTIKNITIDTTIFFYDKNYLQVVSVIESFKLAIKQSFIQVPYRTRGAYNAPTAVSSIATYSSINFSNATSKLEVKKDVQLQKEESYYISDKFDHFFKADKKGFLNVFPSSKKSIILNYINENNIDYNNKYDLEKLLKFCVSIN